MPNYPGAASSSTQVNSNLSPIALHKGESVYLFGTLKTGATQLPVNEGNVSGESPAAPQASISINLQPSETNAPPMVTLEGIFSGAPGSFEVDIQEADTDADAFYITPSNPAYTVTAVNASSQVFRVDLAPTGGKFLRALLKSRTNAVSFILKATRLA